ncbi:MAG: ABC transporter permease [Erysipelotrichaceae bacterium]|nr:ABC transporter permease [Erysipelotrichaceae bacterium]
MIKKLLTSKHDYSGIISSLLAVVIGLAIGFIALVAVKPASALKGFSLLITGGFFNGWKTFGSVFFYATPLILAGLGCAFAFKASIFNIGGPGQMHVGALTCVFVVMNCGLEGHAATFLGLFCGALAGALWSLIPALLNAFKRVNIIITTIMMNYIGLYLAVDLLKKSNVYDPSKNQSVTIPRDMRIPRLGLDEITIGGEQIFRGSSIDAGFFIAVLIAIILRYILEKTTFGYEIKAVGKNRDAADYAGINAKRTIVVSVLISGALMGLAGGFMYLGWAGKFLVGSNTQLSEGFTGIAVTMLAGNNPLGVILSGFFLAYLTQSGSFMQAAGFAPEIVKVITSVVVYCSALSRLVSEYIRKKKLDLMIEESQKEGANKK